MEIYLVRHTKTAIPQGICFGRTDVETAETFPQEAGKVKAFFDFEVDEVFSSPLQRCKKLAQAVWPGRAKTDTRIVELDFGSWEMKKWDDIPQEKLLEWTDNYVKLAPPNGESFETMYARVKNFYCNSVFPLGCNTVAIVTHAGVIRASLALGMNIPLQETFNYPVEHGSITKLVFNDGKIEVEFSNKE